MTVNTSYKRIIIKMLKDVFPVDNVFTSDKVINEYIDKSSVDTNGRTNLTKNTVAFYLSRGPSGERAVSPPTFITDRYVLTINVYTDDSKDKYDNGYNYCEELKDVLDNLYHREYTYNNKTVYIQDCERQGNDDRPRLSKQGIPCFTLNYIITYSK